MQRAPGSAPVPPAVPNRSNAGVRVGRRDKRRAAGLHPKMSHKPADDGDRLEPSFLPRLDTSEWPQLASVLERSATRSQHSPAPSSDMTVLADASSAPGPSAALVSSWPPDEGALPSLESAVRVVSGEAAVLRATRPEEPSVRRAVEAADRAEASVIAAARGGGADAADEAAEPGRDVAAAVLSLQGVDWAKRVETAMGKIDAQGAEFEKQLRHLREHGTLPDEVREVALEQLLDAVGVLAATAHILVLQAEFEGMQHELGALQAAKDDISHTLVGTLRTELSKLPCAVAAVKRWGLEVPKQLLDASESELRSMALAATDPGALNGARGGATVQRVIGALVVAGGATAIKCVAWIDFDDKGEPVFAKDGPLSYKPISRPDIVDTPECARLVTALRVYGERATWSTATLVPKVLGDVSAFADAKAEALLHCDAVRALTRLDKMCKLVPQPCGPPLDDPEKHPKDGLKRAMELVKESDAGAPPPTALEHAVHKQQTAVAGSKRLYQLVSEVVRGVEAHELVVLPGGVKKLARTVFKSAVNYGCDLSRIADQVRCTVVTSTLGGVAAAMRGLVECGAMSVVRVKNRFAADYDATTAGGYVDLQMMVMFQSEDGRWSLGEVQINVWSMLRIKENPEGGHKIFNFARAIRAFDEATYLYTGRFDDSVAARIAAGVMLNVVLKDNGMGDNMSAMVALREALSSGECRMRVLRLHGNKIGDCGAVALADALKRNTSLSKLNLNSNEIGDSGAVALAEALKVNTTVSTIYLSGSRIGPSAAAMLADTFRCDPSLLRVRAKGIAGILRRGRGHDFENLDMLGKGHDGHVYAARHIPTNLILARKDVGLVLDRKVAETIMRECKVLLEWRTPFIVEFYGGFYSNRSASFNLLMEFMDAGTLEQALKGVGRIEEVVCGRIMHSVLRGLAYMWKRCNVIHRDVEPSHILLNSAGEVKLCDLGVSGQLNKSIYAAMKAHVPSVLYASPERIVPRRKSTPIDGAVSDVWCIGVWLVEIALGSYPIPLPAKPITELQPIRRPPRYQPSAASSDVSSVFEQLRTIVDSPPPVLPKGLRFSDEMIHFVEQCCKKDPTERARLQDLLAHPWIRNVMAKKVDMAAWVKDSTIPDATVLFR